MWRDVYQHINTCKQCIQLLLSRMYTQPLHLEIPQLSFAGCPMDCIGPPPSTSKGHRHALTFSCLLTSHLITVPLDIKTADEVLMAYMKEILPKTSYPKFMLQDNCTELKKEQLISMFNSLGIKHLYVTLSNIYQKYYQCLYQHVDPHLSPPTAQQWVSMCIRLICVHIGHLEVLAGIEME